MKNNTRIEWIDIGKYICIMYVMMSHLEACNGWLSTFYSPFFLTGFLFLAGYVYRQPDSFKEHITKKTKGLLVPWLLFSNINILLSAVFTFKSDRNILEEVALNMVQLRGIGDGVWFVAALFVVFIPFYFIIKYCTARSAIILSVLLSLLSDLYNVFMPEDFFPWGSSVLPWHIEYIPSAMLWMVFGYYFKGSAEEKIDRLNTRLNRIILFVIFIYFPYLPFDWGKNVITDISYTYIVDIIGVLLLVMVSKAIKPNWYMRFVGSNTLIYFAFHGKVYALIEHVLNSKCAAIYHPALENDILSIIMAYGIAIIMSFVLMIPAYIINAYFPWMVGRKNKN